MEDFTPKSTKNGNTITISPIFDPNNKELQPDVLDKEFCVSISNCPNFWPSEPRLINRITADYGRSHYIFIEGSPSIPEAIHKYVYHCEGEVNLEERKNFFTKFNLWNEKIPAFCGDFTAERGLINIFRRILTRVKYELLIGYLQQHATHLSLEECRLISLYGLYMTCQDYLAWIKRCALFALETHFPKLKVSLAFFQSNVVVKDKDIRLTITLTNDVPKQGTWQCKSGIPTDNKYAINVVYSVNLQLLHEDFGTVDVTVGSKHKYYGKSLSDKKKAAIFGIYNASEKKTIKYQDTLPTW